MSVDTAFVLGGGGVMGAHEVGMLRALDEAGITPDVIVGTSVGALNGVVVAAAPGEAVARLTTLWSSEIVRTAFAGSWVTRLSTLARSGTHLHSAEPLRGLLARTLPVSRIEDLAVPFQCVAACVERAAAHWFTEGPVVEAVLASCAVPGLLPPIRIGDDHFLDGGLVHSIPIGRAVALGARRVYVLHVGRIERPLTVPKRPWEVGMTAFEIARRHRFTEEMATLPGDVEVHVLPSGGEARPGVDLSQLRYRDLSHISKYIERAYRASAAYLAEQASTGSVPDPPGSAGTP
ncbi:patatin-like phospholipase family protein [Streptosporangium sp. NPDC050855]|uniref:patatin-like phospholipase family protein n=1 Tax=Streptosporangium sp. NPDC050855 TaxID=3366194 RepID=UPI00378FBBD6